MTATEVSPQSEPAQPEVFPQMTAEALERYLEQHPEVPREILAGGIVKENRVELERNLS